MPEGVLVYASNLFTKILLNKGVNLLKALEDILSQIKIIIYILTLSQLASFSQVGLFSRNLQGSVHIQSSHTQPDCHSRTNSLQVHFDEK